MYDLDSVRKLQKIVDAPTTELDTPGPETAQATNEELRERSILELEEMLQEPEMMEPDQEWLQREIVDIIRDQKGNDYVQNMIRQTRLEHLAWMVYATGRKSEEYEGEGRGEPPEGRQQRTQADNAKDFFREMNIPLGEVIPDNVVTFIRDPNGVFHIELPDQVIYHMLEFDLVLDKYIYGWCEEPFQCKALSGVWAYKEVYGDIVNIDFMEIHCQNDNCLVKTNHPLARNIQGTTAEIFTFK